MVDGDKREVLAERAERLLLCLKQRCPGLTQTTLDTTKIQFNKDVGKSILESYSRVLESLAFNIVARIDDVLYVDDLTKCTDKLSSNGPTVSVITHKKVSDTMPFSVPVSSTATTPYRAPFATCSVTPAPSLVSSSKEGTMTPFVNHDSGKPPRRSGPGVRRVLTNYLAGEAKAKSNGNQMEGSTRTISKPGNASPTTPRFDKENADPQKT